jgi:4-alpha-glucanotransferase
MSALTRRASGLLLHPTSLPGPFGNGDLGPCALAFADFLKASRQTWWQMLPLSPVGPGGSPYASPCVFAGNPLLVSLERLVEAGLLHKRDLASKVAPRSPGERIDRADFAASTTYREAHLRAALASLEAQPRHPYHRGIARLVEENRHWLPDFCLYRAIKRAEGGKPWWLFPAELKNRRAPALARARRHFAEEIAFERFVQFVFHAQLRALRAACRDRGVLLMGDAPIFVAHDSVEVWSRPEIFYLDRAGERTVVAGVPPDAFARNGQLWGNPLYRWDVLARSGYRFWVDRLRADFSHFDAVRLDHFIGFARYWAIPRGAKTAKAGKWRKGPGAAFFEHLFRELGPVELVAEDLGETSAEVFALRDRFELPGMRVLQFAFNPDTKTHASRPHRIPPRSVVYTGTHDNDTAVGWFHDPHRSATKAVRDKVRRERDLVRKYLDTDGKSIHRDLLRLAWMSPANTAIAPVQDLLGLGSEGRMNRPGTGEGNWQFRLAAGALDREIAAWLGEMTEVYSRAP